AKKAVNPDTTPAPTVVENSVQIVKTTYTSANDISPNTFSVRVGKPVRMEIDVKDEGSGCMSSIMISRLTQPQFLEKGKTLVFEFTPDKSGEFPITCAMGVPRGSIKVI
ncbi:MAG: cupredoxin domain-containing protein, partial [Patescibacteria group bacterium]